ncbi:MAG: ABC transporter transmembrane domain-containing protein [Aurantimonas endophytica]|uniref:Putative ABC transport system ATP-binding protein n=1 Tax=Aurantimonas endophytica TaxID=1522175 RepID=A0A7W6MQ80_9HYPH|nr:ABC transporter transmembrane domain-containing protein [Aurantimonas endophytica]MBB4003693.1 putative ABC transport system ATP-binding protein [Aurantimonas endophytica]MCO6404549.1 ATP-binding cassette domain-containing protein [Aurantimonas endophytica]
MARGDQLDESIFGYVWRHTKRQQLWLFFVLALSLPLYYLTLDLPKRIVNGPIQGEWAAGETQPLFRWTPTLPDFLGGGTLQLFGGIEVDRFGMLVALSLTFLFFVVVNGLFKFYLSNYKGQLGERLLRRLRYDLVDRVLRFPTGRFKQVRGPEIASMVKDETEPVGGFGGSAFADPALLLSQAATALLFIFLQNVWLGGVAGAVVLVQLIIIPRMRRRLVVLARARQLTARLLSGRIGEIVDSIPSIRVNDTSSWERAEIGGRLGRILQIRTDFFRWKFLVNFINNLLAQTTPFIFYLAGGYFVIVGQLDIGQLVAVIAAYKDLPAPLKELIAWDQFRVDVQSKYAQITEQFTMPDLIDPERQKVSQETPPHIEGDIAIVGLRIADESGNDLLEPTSLRLAPGEAVAAVGPVSGGGEYLADALVRLVEPASGRISIDGRSLDSLPDAFVGRRFGYSTSGLYFAQMSVRDALVYGLRHAPVNGHDGTGRPDPERLSEAWRSGDASSLCPEEWIDYAAAGIEGPQQLSGRLAEVLEIVELRVDIARLGLRNRLPADLPEEVGPRVLAARARFRERLAEGGDEDYFETFDPERYSDYASLIENLVFGIPLPEALMGNSLAERPQMREVLKQTGLDVMLFDMGRQIAETLIEIFGDLSPDNPLMESVDLMSPDEVDDYRTALRRTSGEGPHSGKYRRAFQELAFGYIEPKHRLGLLDDRIRSAVLAARARFGEKLEPDLAQAVSVHSPTALNPAASFQDNVLFGRVVDRYAEAAARINEVLVATLYDTGLAEVVFEIGLDFDIGSGAKRLSAGQQQKLALARALLKRPDLLVLNRPLSALDGDSQQATIGRVLASREALGVPRQTVFWVLSHAEHAHFFDRTLEFRDGRMTMIDAHVPHPVDEPA